jgi:Ca-activated chloride channel family protein
MKPTIGVVVAGLTFAVSLGASTPQFRTTTKTVAVYATVIDKAGAPVRDLTAADFQIEDGGAKTPITVFKSDVEPISVAVLLDTSPSLFPVASRTGLAVGEFMKHLTAGDRACAGTFSQSVTLDPSLSGDASVIVRRLASPTPWPAGTAIWDAVDAGRKALEPEGGKRVVILVTDGADNSSRTDPNEARNGLQRAGLMVYAIAVRGRFGLDTSEIGALANATGGRTIELRAADDIPAAMAAIADELHHQYTIGFTPEKLDDKLHRVEVKVKRAGLTVRAARSYLAAKADGR